VSTDTADASTYGEQLRKQLQRSLIEKGHSACRYNDQARYDPATGTVKCGCGTEVALVGAQPTRLPEPPPDNDWPATSGAPIGANTVAKDPVQATLATIDPTMAYTPVDLEMRILDVLARLEQGALFERSAIERAAFAEMAWKRDYWIARESSEAGAADRREADAMLKTLELHQEYLETSMVAKAVKATMHNLRAILSGYQSVARSVTADYQAGGAVR
jgi:hypothetical protein